MKETVPAIIVNEDLIEQPELVHNPDENDRKSYSLRPRNEFIDYQE